MRRARALAKNVAVGAVPDRAILSQVLLVLLRVVAARRGSPNRVPRLAIRLGGKFTAGNNDFATCIASCPGQPRAKLDDKLACLLRSVRAITGPINGPHVGNGEQKRNDVLPESGNVHVLDPPNAIQRLSAAKQRRRAEEKDNQALRESERLLRDMINALPAAIYTTDAEGYLTHFNPAARIMSGREPQLGTDKWCVTWKLFLPDGTPLPHAECPMAIAIKENRIVHGVEAVAERPDGTRISAIANATPLHDSQGKVIGGINMLVDITLQKESQARQALLSRELEHRTQNLFAVIQSIATRSVAGERTLEEARNIFTERLHALAHANDMLIATSWAGAPLSKVIDRGMAAFSGRYAMEGEPVILNMQSTQSFALIIHELCTNASKYGAFSESKGHVAMRWSVIKDDVQPRFVFRWQEHDGPHITKPARTSFGSLLLQRSIAGFSHPATLDYAPDGLIYTLNAPLAAVCSAPG